MTARIGACLAAAVAFALAATGSSQASEAIDAFNVGTSTTQAGGHPDLQTTFTLHSPGAPEAAKTVAINLPEGLFGNPNAVVPCLSTEFALDQCPSVTQVGVITVRANHAGVPNNLLGTAPLFVVEPTPEETARLAFIVPTLDIPINIPVSVRTGTDYGLTLTVSNITQTIPLAGVNIRLWGFPADRANDIERFAKGSPGAPANCPGTTDATCTGPHSVAVGNRPLTDNPTICTGQPLAVSLEVVTYQDADTVSRAQSDYPPTTECDRESFNPVLEAGLTTNQTDSASGLDLLIKAAQFESHAAAPSQIRAASITLPLGLSINPDAADGQRACSDAQANFGSNGPAACPDNSKIGNFDMETPALNGSLPGSLYFGEPEPGNPYRIFLVADGFGIHAKLAASVIPDPQTGQLTLNASDLPQVPFEAFNLHLFSSDRGLVATPTQCTIYATDSLFVPWNDLLAPQHSRPNLSLTSGPNGAPCPGVSRPFVPRLEAGMSSPLAGAFSSFHLKLDRDDGDQFLGKLNFTMPPGLTADLRGISYCPDAAILAAAQTAGRTEQASPSCPGSSEIGTSNVAAGPGAHPFHAFGKVYLSGPFQGAPLSLAAITPALAGPYDYGTVVVRVALHIDPEDAHVIADSETVPQIIGGIPIRMRSIQVNIDRPRFMINPTNCSPFSVVSEGIGDQGAAVSFSSYFHAVNCSGLGFRPKMSITQLDGHKGTARGRDPSIRFDLNTRPGDANIKSLAVTLSNAFEIDQSHLGNICSEKELAATQCAGRQAIGMATTVTPLLTQPLTGPVYAVSGSGGLPRLSFLLNGQVNLLPRADTQTVGGRLQTTVPVIPDAPIGHFHLVIFGGKRGYLINTRDLCAHRPLIQITYNAQNGKSRKQKIRLKAPCGKR